MFEIMTSMERRWLFVENNGCPGGYEEQMLRHNRPDGLLPMEIFVWGGKKQYRYEVTGCKNLTEIMAGKKVTGEMMQALFSEMFSCVMKGKRYLLLEDNYCIAPESIFFRESDQKLFLCYVPGFQKPLLQQMQRLSEWILEHLDVQDSQAVYQGYAMHMLCREGKTSFQELLNLFVTAAPPPPTVVQNPPAPYEIAECAKIRPQEEGVAKKKTGAGRAFGRRLLEGLLLLVVAGILVYMLP